MNLHKVLATESYVYKTKPSMIPAGIMVHSTGCNNPNLRRYVAPDDGLLGTPSSVHWNQYYINGKVFTTGVHAFIGKLKDGTIATYQVQEWNKRCNHAGLGTSGKSANANYISFEICEDDLKSRTYFEAVYKEAVELCAYLCKIYKLDPLKNIICHSEGYRKGIACNHGDVEHWFPKYGKSMDQFRVDVYNEMEENNMDKNVFAEHYNQLMDDLKAKPGSMSAEFKAAQKKATDKGYVKGDDKGREMWKCPLTREEFFLILDRMGLL